MSETRAVTRVLIVGANGMLGNAVVRWFARFPEFQVMGAVRNLDSVGLLAQQLNGVEFIEGVRAESLGSLVELLDRRRPEVVINCVGVVKQLAGSEDPAMAIPINALLPHRLARLCSNRRARLVHISTDCVFSGSRGCYKETDVPDAMDLYGRSKLMGEVDYPCAVTLRTSIIGHELSSAHGLVGWFLSQQGTVKGFSRAIFSALPTVELARVIQEYVLPNPQLRGTLHVGAAAISKHALLELIAKEYGAGPRLLADDGMVLDRSLDSSRFQKLTGYMPPSWPELVHRMRQFG